jgi:hypothetical protein
MLQKIAEVIYKIQFDGKFFINFFLLFYFIAIVFPEA